MKIKIFLLCLLLVGVFCISSGAYAQTMTEAQRQMLIAQIQQQIIQIQAQINQILLARKNCKPNWQCGDWGLCINSQQSKTCTDLNSCGVLTGQPKTSQACTQNYGVQLRINNSDGPVNIFVPFGNGSYVNGPNVYLSQTINLQWQGINVASCVVSDSTKSSVFSGYRPSSGSQAFTVTGTIKSNGSSGNKVSDTFKITCISTKTGASVSDSATVNLFYTIN